MFNELEVKTALTKLKRKIPYGWDLNVYRGCAHGCRYCYALYSHGHLGHTYKEDFYHKIYVKSNIVDILERELSSPNWNGDVINLGGVTDSYQPAEKEYKIIPAILKLLIKYKTPVIISTKSSLILRDFDLIDKLSRITYVNIAATITTINEELRKLIEPGSSPAAERFKVLKEFAGTGCSTGLHIMPIIPLLTDSVVNLDGLLFNGADCKVDYVLPGVLYLRGATRKVFFDFMKDHFPDLLEPFKQLYPGGGAIKNYKDNLYKKFNSLRDHYRLSRSYMKPMREKLEQQKLKQISIEEVIGYD
jgi:DNA repair photolyase